MSTEYSLDCQNKSQMAGSFCIFHVLKQKDPSISLKPKSLIWFAKKVHPNNSTHFTWSDAVYFVWGETPSDERVIISQKMIADATKPNKNTATYTYQDGAYLLSYLEKQKPTEGKLTIKVNDTARNNENAVGIGMFTKDSGCGTGTVVYDVMRNYTYPILPETHYYVTFGNYVKGQIIDIDNMTTPYKKIPFSPDKPSFTVTMRQDNQIGVKAN